MLLKWSHDIFDCRFLIRLKSSIFALPAFGFLENAVHITFTPHFTLPHLESISGVLQSKLPRLITCFE